MNKIISLLVLSLMITSVCVAKDRISPVAHTNEYYEMNANSQDYNFENTTNYLTEEQMKDAQEIDNIDDNSSFWDKIINSSHFSSNTATKTYIPINKVQK